MGYKLVCPEEEVEIVSSMLSDLQYAIEWMNKGHAPGPRRDITRLSREQRTLQFDPLHLQSWAQPAACGSPTTLTGFERTQIDEAMRTLSERERQAYTLHVALCFSLAQTAQEMNTSKSTVQSYVERAKEKIRKEREANLFLAI
ncbi:sigma factor-like helix-turn-helix DNA-binding protein [Paenibacillus senegalimassiliensis]|uniref:sigma factor-like helix-turn-helix DNA-binding protein n=1 Tax=Paenibacillus senegalimassiliensis TaxID=1737426 RepID=UPI0009E71954